MSHPSIQITTALFARLSGDDDLREAITALLPGELGNADGLRRKTSQPLNQTDLTLRFASYPGPKASPTYPLVLWRRVGDASDGGRRCGTLGATRTRYRVYVVNQGRDRAALETAAERVYTLLAGYTSGVVTFVADASWEELSTGDSGDFIELGYEFIAVHRGV